MRKFIHATAAGVALAASLLGAVPASAATAPASITVSGCTTTPAVDATSVAWTSATDTLTVVNNCSVGIILYAVSGGIQNSVGGAPSNSTGATSALGSDVTAIRIRQTGPITNPVLATLSATSPSSGGGGGGSSSSAASAPVLETLTLAVSTGSTTCTSGSPTGYTGSWLQLPAANACSQSGPNANPNAKLLGWATDPIFPVSVAQEIVDLKYGPIDGNFHGMRMIFIPAGGWTFVSGSNTLYPIWSS